MNRRKSIKRLALAGMGMVTLPAWAQGWSTETLQLPDLLSFDDQDVLAAVVDTIIPQGDAIGALSVGVDKFLHKLLADCYEPEIQGNVKVQLQALDDGAQASYGRPFAACSQEERELLLMAMSDSEAGSRKEFFDLMKGETIRGFRTSREVLMNYYDYKPAPGHYYGCVDINPV